MNENTRKILNKVFAVVAIVSALVAIGLTPPVKKLLSGNKEPVPSVVETTDEETTVIPETAPPTETSAPQSDSVSHTTVDMNPYRSYTIFVDKRDFECTEDKGVLKAVAKGNKAVSMVITPHFDKSYDTLCDETLNFYNPIEKTLDITAQNSAYRSQSGDMDDDVITTVYCVDAGKNGSVEIVVQLAVNAQSYGESFEIFLSMFKIL